MRVHGLRFCFIRPGRVQATPRSCRIRTCGMWFLGSGTASKTDATSAAVMIPISPWQPGVLAAGSGSCAADGCQHRQLTLWTNPSPGNKHRPRSITPCAPGFSRRRGNGPRRGDLPPPPPNASKQSFIVPSSVYGVIRAKFMPPMWLRLRLQCRVCTKLLIRARLPAARTPGTPGTPAEPCGDGVIKDGRSQEKL